MRHRVKTAPRFEGLEGRALLSSDVSGATGLLGVPALTIDTGSYDPTRILVRYRDESAAARADASGGASMADVVPGLRDVPLVEGVAVEAALAAYRSDPDVLYAEPDYRVSVTGIPNDPRFASLWGLNNTGQTGGTADADIDAPEAWDITTGSPSTIVAVIDTGVDYNHPDLAANIWTNTREIAGNGLDDDGNGYADDVHGYDFVNRDGNPIDDNGHGTHVAGTIAAVGNNGIGVAGVAWNVKIMALKFLAANGNGSLSDAISAINYAVANGATISNNSWSGGGYSQALSDAIRNAAARNHIFVAAAGNGGADGLSDNNDQTPTYPASFNLDNIVAVAATDASDQLARFSNYGATSVDLAAPGVTILSTTPNNTYSYYSGTSMATPHVAGVLALVSGQHPDWTYSQVINRVLTTTDPVAGLAGKVVTGGRLNAARAVASVDATGPQVTASSPSGTVAGPVSTVRVTFDEAIDPASFTAADVALTGPAGAISVSGVAAVAGSNNTQFDITFASQSAPGTYPLTLGPDVRDPSGNQMDQNRDGVRGGAGDQYTTSFTISNLIGEDAVYQASAFDFEAIDLVPGGPGVYTLLNAGDDQAFNVNLGGYFNFYGAAYTSVSVSTNGLLTFGGSDSSNANTDLTSSPVPRSIAPLWDNWVNSAGNPMVLGKIEDTNADGIRDRVILEWNKVQGFGGSPSTVTFQAILQLNTGSTPGRITFNYPDLDAGNGLSNGGSATVGIKDNGTQGARRLLVSYNNGSSPFVGSGKAIRFTPRVGAAVATSEAATAPPTSGTDPRAGSDGLALVPQGPHGAGVLGSVTPKRKARLSFGG